MSDLVIDECADKAEEIAQYLEKGYGIEVEVPEIEEDTKGILSTQWGWKAKIADWIPILALRPRAAVHGGHIEFKIEEDRVEWSYQDKKILVNYTSPVPYHTLPELMAHELGHLGQQKDNLLVAVGRNPEYVDALGLDQEKLLGLMEAAGYYLESCIAQDKEPGKEPEIDQGRTSITERHDRGLKIADKYSSNVLTTPRSVYEDLEGEAASDQEIIELILAE